MYCPARDCKNNQIKSSKCSQALSKDNLDWTSRKWKNHAGYQNRRKAKACSYSCFSNGQTKNLLQQRRWKSIMETNA